MIDVVVQIPEESEVEEAAPQRKGRRRSADVSRSLEQTYKILREKYGPAALICTGPECVSPLLATRKESYSKTWPPMTAERLLKFICARCQREAAEKERVREVRVEKGRKGYEARRGRESREGLPIAAPVENDPNRVRPIKKPAPVKAKLPAEMGPRHADSGIHVPGPLPASLARARRRAAARTRGRMTERERKRAYRARRKKVA